MNQKHFRLAKSVCVLLVLCGLSTSLKASTTITIPKDTIKIDLEKNNGRTSLGTSHKGTIISVELGGISGGTGYSWVDNTKPSASIMFIKNQLVSSDSSLMGAPAKLVFLYEVTGKKGSAKLEFSLQRPWEKKTVRTFQHKIKVCGKK